MVFTDQSGFYLLPLVLRPSPEGLRTYAPAGQTPVVREYLTHDHLSAMSAITPEGNLYMTMQEQSYKGPDVVNSLRSAAGRLRHIPGKLLVLRRRPRFIAVGISRVGFRGIWPVGSASDKI